MSHKDPKHQWAVLCALCTPPPFPRTEKQLHGMMTIPISRQGVRSRLKELWLMHLCERHKEPGDKFIRHDATKLGWRVFMMGNADGQFQLLKYRAMMKPMENDRAVELAPIKEKHDILIRNRMYLNTLIGL